MCFGVFNPELNTSGVVKRLNLVRNPAIGAEVLRCLVKSRANQIILKSKL